VNKLAIKSNDTGLEVRCIMPPFERPTERKQTRPRSFVLGLTGINVSVDNDDYPLPKLKLPLCHARLQVYFLDNEDFF